MKYVILRCARPTFIHSVPIIFPKELVHSDVARALCHMRQLADYEPVSAGEVSIGMDCTCSGFSETLQLGTRPGDEQLINMVDYGGCFEAPSR